MTFLGVKISNKAAWSSLAYKAVLAAAHSASLWAERYFKLYIWHSWAAVSECVVSKKVSNIDKKLSGLSQTDNKIKFPDVNLQNII